MNRRLQDLLDGSNVKYEVLPHREAYTAQEIAAQAHVSGRQLAKVVMVRANDGAFLMAVAPAASRIDLEALSRVSGRTGLSIAHEPEFAPLFSDCEIGAMPPFGNLYAIPVFVDESFSRVPEIVFEAGNHHEAVRMPYRSYLDLAKPEVGHFARPWIFSPGEEYAEPGPAAP